MKKGKILAWVAALCAATLLTGLLAACDDDGENNGGEPQTYTITAAESEDYTLTPDKTSAAAGDMVTVTAEMKNTDKYITGVKYNEEDCDEEDGKYTFTMPAANVTLSAVTENYEQVTQNGFATLINTDGATFGINSGTATLRVEFSSGTTNVVTQFASSNPSVLPTDEETISVYLEADGSFAESADIRIDTSRVSLGSAWLTMTFKNSNTGRTSVLSIKITVAETVTVEKWTETLVFDVSSLRYGEDAKYYIAVRENYHIAGSDAKESQIFDEVAAVDDEVTVQIEYVPGHTYSITFGYIDAEAEHGYTWHNLNEVTGSGSSVTGFNQYVDGELSFISDGQSLKIKVATTTHT